MEDEIQVQGPRSPTSPKSISFMNMDNNNNNTTTTTSPGTAVTTPTGEPTQSQAELTKSPTNKTPQRKRPSFKRSLSSLWKVLDPPELSHNTGALHNISKQNDDDSAHRRKKSHGPEDLEREHRLLSTISDKAYRQRW